MAILHRAQLTPTKLELLARWLPAQPWFVGDPEGEPTRVAAFRFDDPDGEVGIETMLVRAGEGPVLQVPLTYRGAPLEGAEPFLVGTMDHSVLGPRWVYDACGDPVYAAVLASVVLERGTGAAEFFATDDGLVERPASAEVRGTGPVAGRAAADGPADDAAGLAAGARVTVVRAGAWELAVLRVLEPGAPEPDAARRPGLLVGRWDGEERAHLLVRVLGGTAADG